MPKRVVCQGVECPRPSRGVLPRLHNMAHAARIRGELHHVTGDVHYVALALPAGRTILTIHDCVSLNRLKGLRRDVLKLFWYSLPIRRCALVTTISSFSKDELLKNVDANPDKIRVVHDPLPSGFEPCSAKFDTRKPVLLHVGTKENKNLERVARALEGITCRLEVVGRVDERQRAILAECRIDWSESYGLTDQELLATYRQCDMVVFASTYEGFGMPILEAQATGRPLVTSNICSMPEVAGEGACLVDPFSVASIREGVLRVCADSAYREDLVAAGLENVRRFRPERIAADYLALYEEVLP